MEKKPSLYSNQELADYLKTKNSELSKQIERKEYLILKDGYFEDETEDKKIALEKKNILKIISEAQKDLVEVNDLLYAEALNRFIALSNECGFKRVQKRFEHLQSDLKFNS